MDSVKSCQQRIFWYQNMPCRLLVTIKEARALPVMDKASESTDAYVEVFIFQDQFIILTDKLTSWQFYKNQIFR